MKIWKATVVGASGIIFHRTFPSFTHAQCKPKYSTELLRINTLKALQAVGHSKSDALIISDVLMYAELRGNNQGIIKLVTGGLNYDSSCSEIRCLHETEVSAKIDGGQRIGMVVVSESVKKAIDKAKVSGISIVGCSNYASATGALGYWAKQITNAGFIGIVMSQCNEMVAPHGSYEPIFGTNPITIGVPTLPRAQILDMATSASAYYGIKLAESMNQPIPSDVAYDVHGQPTTDAGKALKGAIRVFDRSFKGSHLALMVELLAGALTGAAMEDKNNAKNWGSLVIVIDPALLGSRDDFLQRADVMCQRVKEAKLVEGFEEILLPGERGDRMEAEAIAKGQVPLSEDIYNELLKLAAKMDERQKK